MKEFVECLACGNKIVIEDSRTCEVCGDLFCRECIGENEIGEEICYVCSDC